MFGLEKNEKKPKKFDFDLEIEIKKNPAQGKKYLAKAEGQIKEIKKELRENPSANAESLGVLLHGYTSLQKVLSKI